MTQCCDHDARSVAQRDLVLRLALHPRPIGLQRDQVVADSGDLLDQVLAGRVVPAVNGVRVVGQIPPADRASDSFLQVLTLVSLVLVGQFVARSSDCEFDPSPMDLDFYPWWPRLAMQAWYSRSLPPE